MLNGAPRIMTAEQVAKYLCLHVMTIRQLARDGEIPAFKVGKLWRFKKELLEQWIVKQWEMNVAALCEAQK